MLANITTTINATDMIKTGKGPNFNPGESLSE